MPISLANVHGTELLAGDTREQYRQKLARITLDSMVQFVGLLDAQGTVLEINQVALDGGGLRLADVEGKPFWTTFWWQVSEDINKGLREAIQRAAQGEFVRWDTEIYGRASGKETIVIDASLMPVKDAQGNVVFIAAEGRDITEKKAQEREIARQREELAKLDELKTQFFANISHEFRTPLTLMLGPLEDAMADGEAPLDERQRERLAMVHRNGLRLQKLVNALLDFSRVEAGRVEAVYQATDLASLTSDLASSFRAACEKAGLTLTIDTPPLSAPVFVDHEMWEKIVLNLVSNAFKFTLEGAITIGISEQDGQAVLRVGDTGTGILESELPRIFDRFHRVAGARGRTHEGTGIGLALVKELVELHKGTVSVESTPGKGSVFTVRLPFGSAHLPQDRLEAARTLASTATRPDAFVSEALRLLPSGVTTGKPDGPAHAVVAPPERRAAERPRVLIADDNADMREYLTRILATDYDVTAVADGEAALAAARRTGPDLILTDVMMPQLDGFGLLRGLRADVALSAVPVIVLSARAGEEAKVEGLRMGADDYLVKPFSARELLARVTANIALARTRMHGGRVLQEEAQTLELLNTVGTAVAAELDLERAVQIVTDAATELSGAAFGSFFYNVVDRNGETYTLYALSGVTREAFAKFPMPRNTAVFGPTFRGEGVVRSDDITKDPRYGKNAPHRGMPEGHLPVRSYLAAPVKSRSGEVLGGLFFGHPEIGIFTEREERIVAAIAVQAGIAIDKARLYRAAQDEIVRRKEVEQNLRESEARYRLALSAGQMGNWETDFVTRTRIWSEEGMALFGLKLPNGRGTVGGETDEYTLALHPDDRHLVPEYHELADRQDSFPAEYRIVRPDGTIRWLAGRGQVVGRSADGKAERLVSIMADVTDRKAAEDHIQFLMREISHRSKNLLSVVQAIAAQTGRFAGSTDDFQVRFSRRLQGLAASHDLLVNQNWQGATLADLVRNQVTPFVEAGSERLHAAGPDVFMSPESAEALGLALHELSTNAVKYGSLSAPAGHVAVTWGVRREDAAPALWIKWLERGGPAVTPPLHKGFGHIVFERILTRSLGGTVTMDFAPEGLSWDLSIPTANLVSPTGGLRKSPVR